MRAFKTSLGTHIAFPSSIYSSSWRFDPNEIQNQQLGFQHKGERETIEGRKHWGSYRGQWRGRTKDKKVFKRSEIGRKRRMERSIRLKNRNQQRTNDLRASWRTKLKEKDNFQKLFRIRQYLIAVNFRCIILTSTR